MEKMEKDKIDLLLINPSPMPLSEQLSLLDKTSDKRLPYFGAPIGLLELAAYIRERINNINIFMLDIAKDLYKIFLDRDDTPKMNFEQFLNLELNTVKFIPDIVGISIMYTTSHKSSLKIAEIVKKKWDNITLICGGNQATSCYEQFLSNPNIDYVVRGEGELSFVEFLKEYRDTRKQGRNINISGIYNRQKLKNAKNKNELSPMIDDLDDIPIPAYDLLDIDFYRKNSNIKNKGAIHIMWSRGCPFKCTFCASHSVHGRAMRFKSNDKIIMALSYLIEDLNFEKVWIEDDLFAKNKKKFLELEDRIRTNGWHGKIGIRNGLSVKIADEKTIDVVCGMGINQITLNIESGSPYTQKHIIKKNVPLAKAKQLIQYARTKDMEIDIPIILGFPGETLELMQESINFAYSIDVDWVFFLCALPIPGADMFEQFVEMGVINYEKYNWDTRFQQRNFDVPEITGEQLTQVVYDANIDRNFFHNSNLKLGRYARAIDSFNDVINSYPFQIVAIYCRGLAYMGLGEKEKGNADFERCAELIRSDEEKGKEKLIGDLQGPKQLYDRYGNKMSYLTSYLGDLATK